jgi:predicted esterase
LCYIENIMSVHHIDFSFSGRYYKTGELTAHTRQLWFVLHGYAQLAEHFIKKFAALEEHGICVIAPEGLSRFYLEPLSNRMQTGDSRVGATWMTKEDRQTDITNYLTYLNAIYRHETGHATAVPVTVLGFSQGAATASRWIADGQVKADRFILWAGILPPDMNFEAGRAALQGKQTFMVYGTEDPYLNDTRFAELDLLSDKLGVQPQRITFTGRHEIHAPTLLRFV